MLAPVPSSSSITHSLACAGAGGNAMNGALETDLTLELIHDAS